MYHMVAKVSGRCCDAFRIIAKWPLKMHVINNCSHFFCGLFLCHIVGCPVYDVIHTYYDELQYVAFDV